MRYLFIALALAEASAFAGEATVTDQFELDAPFERVTAWIDANGAAIRDAVNVKLVEQHRDTLTLRRENNRGCWVWKQREDVSKTAGRWSYTTKLVECVEGGVTRLDGTVTIEELGGRTKITATTSAEVEDIKSRDLRFDLFARARRIKKLITEAVE
jgi:hypothetical protein